jgi:hypothetical protein
MAVFGAAVSILIILAPVVCDSHVHICRLSILSTIWKAAMLIGGGLISYWDGYEATYKNLLKQIQAELNAGNGFPGFLADMKVEGMQAVSPVLHKYAI